MKAMFGVVSLLVVLAIVGVLASRQMKAVTVAPAAAGAAPAGNVREQSQQVQEKVRSDVTRAMEQGARKDESDK